MSRITLSNQKPPCGAADGNVTGPWVASRWMLRPSLSRAPPATELSIDSRHSPSTISQMAGLFESASFGKVTVASGTRVANGSPAMARADDTTVAPVTAATTIEAAGHHDDTGGGRNGTGAHWLRREATVVPLQALQPDDNA